MGQEFGFWKRDPEFWAGSLYNLHIGGSTIPSTSLIKSEVQDLSLQLCDVLYQWLHQTRSIPSALTRMDCLSTEVYSWLQCSRFQFPNILQEANSLSVKLILNSESTPQIPKDGLYISYPLSNPCHFNSHELFANIAVMQHSHWYTWIWVQFKSRLFSSRLEGSIWFTFLYDYFMEENFNFRSFYHSSIKSWIT